MMAASRSPNLARRPPCRHRPVGGHQTGLPPSDHAESGRLPAHGPPGPSGRPAGAVLTGRLGQPGTHPGLAGLAQPDRARKLQRQQPARVGQRHPGQRLRVDPVGPGVPARTGASLRPWPTTPGTQRARQPKNTAIGIQAARPARTPPPASCPPVPRPAPPAPPRPAMPPTARTTPGTPASIGFQHPHRMPRRDPQVDPDQPPARLTPLHCHLRKDHPSLWLTPAAHQAATTFPSATVPERKSRQRLPFMCCNRARTRPGWPVRRLGQDAAAAPAAAHRHPPSPASITSTTPSSRLRSTRRRLARRAASRRKPGTRP